MAMNVMTRAREVQDFAGKQLYPDGASLFTDVDGWKQIQLHLSQAVKDLERMEGVSPEEEGERLLAILMGYCVTVRNSRNISQVLERAERVLPCLEDRVLKCKLAAFCYLEIPDKELLILVRSLIAELKQQGRQEDIFRIEEMISD